MFQKISISNEMFLEQQIVI